MLSKGPVGLYPLVTPLVAYVTLRRQTLVRAVAENVALVALFFGIIWLVCLLPGAAAYYDKYLHGQVLAAMQGRREVVNSILGRFDILWKVAQQVVLPLAIAVGLIWIARIRQVAEAGLAVSLSNRPEGSPGSATASRRNSSNAASNCVLPAYGGQRLGPDCRQPQAIGTLRVSLLCVLRPGVCALVRTGRDSFDDERRSGGGDASASHSSLRVRCDFAAPGSRLGPAGWPTPSRRRCIPRCAGAGPSSADVFHRRNLP